MTDRLIAVANGRLVGEITRDARGRLDFEYDAVWREDGAAHPVWRRDGHRRRKV